MRDLLNRFGVHDFASQRIGEGVCDPAQERISRLDAKLAELEKERAKIEAERKMTSGAIGIGLQFIRSRLGTVISAPVQPGSMRLKSLNPLGPIETNVD